MLKSGYLSVGDSHQIYYEAYGNPKGLPVLFVHGGPGAGFSDNDKDFFDFKKQFVIFFDQRGSGFSKPFASTKQNTTDHLVKDMNKLLDLFKIKKVFLFGGSWGSTLSLIYAIRNPKRVSGMLLRGIYLSTKKENNHYLGGGVAASFPENWERFLSLVPKSQRKNIAKYYLSKMQSKNKTIRKKHCFEWAYYEISIAKLYISPEQVKEYMKDYSYESLSPLEAHFISNGCFIPENYILKNIKKLKNIPLTILHGRYDAICLPSIAYALHKSLPHSKLQFLTAGHSSGDPELKKALQLEMKKHV